MTNPARLHFWAYNPKIFGPPFKGCRIVIENLKVLSVGRPDLFANAVGGPWPRFRDELKRRGIKLKPMKKPDGARPWQRHPFKRKVTLVPGKLRNKNGTLQDHSLYDDGAPVGNDPSPRDAGEC